MTIELKNNLHRRDITMRLYSVASDGSASSKLALSEKSKAKSVSKANEKLAKETLIKEGITTTTNHSEKANKKQQKLVNKASQLNDNFEIFKVLSKLLPKDVYYKYCMTDVIPQCFQNKPFEISINYSLTLQVNSKDSKEKGSVTNKTIGKIYTFVIKVTNLNNIIYDNEICKQAITFKPFFSNIKIKVN